MFDSSVALLNDYYRRMASTLDIQERDLLMEVRERLAQLDYLLERVDGSVTVILDAHERNATSMQGRMSALEAAGLEWESSEFPIESMSEAEYGRLGQALLEARLFVECFYFVAWRIVTICRTTEFQHLRRFDPKGVRMVRNALLEHAGEKAFPVTSQSFAFGGSDGPVMKAIRSPEESEQYEDPGLRVNATEFRDELSTRLQRALDELDET